MQSNNREQEWAGLGAATGTCEHIPDAIERLCSGDKAARRAACWEIENHVIVQGDLYEGAPFVVRELVERLSGDPPGKEEVYDLLVEFAHGDAPETERVEFSGAWLSVKSATTKALVSGMEWFHRDLADTDVCTRRHVASLLLALSAEGRPDVERLRGAAASEADEEARASLEEALAVLEGSPA